MKDENDLGIIPIIIPIILGPLWIPLLIYLVRLAFK